MKVKEVLSKIDSKFKKWTRISDRVWATLFFMCSLTVVGMFAFTFHESEVLQYPQSEVLDVHLLANKDTDTFFVKVNGEDVTGQMAEEYPAVVAAADSVSKTFDTNKAQLVKLGLSTLIVVTAFVLVEVIFAALAGWKMILEKVYKSLRQRQCKAS